MAPEIITGEGLVAGAQDIWSLGCCVIEMVTGRKPWGIGSDWAISKSIYSFLLKVYQVGTSDKFPKIPEPSQLDPAGFAFLERCIQRHPKDRATVAELKVHEWILATSQTTASLLSGKSFFPELPYDVVPPRFTYTAASAIQPALKLSLPESGLKTSQYDDEKVRE